MQCNEGSEVTERRHAYTSWNSLQPHFIPSVNELKAHEWITHCRGQWMHWIQSISSFRAGNEEIWWIAGRVKQPFHCRMNEWNWMEFNWIHSLLTFHCLQFIQSFTLREMYWIEWSYYNSTWLYQSLLQWPWMKCWTWRIRIKCCSSSHSAINMLL